jgi:hypothetical protein
MNTSYPKGETSKKFEFIRKYLYILPGHWGGYWHIETFPIVKKIIINDNFDQAIVDFRFGIGQTAIQYKLYKKRGKWSDNGNERVRFWQE